MTTLTLDLNFPAPENGAAITPRPYQEDAITKVLEAHESGKKKQLGVAATGLGKTIIFTELARRLNVPTLMLAHRDELIRQMVDKTRLVWPDIPVGIVKAERDEWSLPVVAASVQTLSRQNRLDRVKRGFELVIVDEAHHASADSYRRVLNHFGCDGGANAPLLLGVTATPDRGDKVGLKGVFDDITFVYDILWGIEEGYLCDLRAKEILLELDLDKVRTQHGDYVDSDLGNALEAAGAPEHTFNAWREHAHDRKTLIFTPTVATAASMAQEFAINGVNASFVHAGTPLDERRDLLRKFSDGTIQVLANCAVLTEGYDEPSIDCIIVARPTKSRAFYQQIIGRGTRKFPGKVDCLILDVIGTARHHRLVTVASLVGADEAKMRKGMSVRQAIAAVVAEQEAAKKGRLVVNEIDLFAPLEETQFSWLKTPKGFSLPIPGGHMTLMKVTDDGFGVVFNRRDNQGKESRTILRQTRGGLSLEVAQGVAEDWVRMNKAVSLASKEATWRAKPATAKQIEALRKWKVPVPKGLTAGQASDLMTQKIASKGLL